MDLLGRARKFIQGLGASTEARAQYYSVSCPNGHRVRGQRTESYQALRCPACGEGVFVLPASPLPEPVPSLVTRPAWGSGGTGVMVEEGPIELKDPDQVTVDLEEPPGSVPEIEIDWEEEGDPGAAPTDRDGPRGASPPRNSEAVAQSLPPEKPERRKPPAAPPRVVSRSSPRGANPPAGPVADSPGRPYASGRGTSKPDSRRVAVEPLEVQEIGGSRRIPGTASHPTALGQRRRRKPVAIFLAVAVLVVGTIALRAWREHRQSLPLVAELGRTEGIAALEEGKFDKAYQLLAAAKVAVDTLGGAYEDADRIRHAADEAAIFVDLLPSSLEELLEEAGRTNPQSWRTRFENLYKGRGVIIDARIIATPSGPTRGYELDYLVLPPGEGVNFREPGGARPQRYARIDLSGFEAITLAEPQVGDHVLFGARIDSFDYDGEREEWVVRLEPRSGVSIQYVKALEALGWPSSVELFHEP